MKKIYVSCSLTQAPEEFKTNIEELKINLRKDYEVLDWLGLTKGTEKDVYKHDTEMVKACDFLLAEVSHPSLGAGFEISLALQLKKSVLAVAQRDAYVGRFILGITEPNYLFARYENMEELMQIIKTKFNTQS